MTPIDLTPDRRRRNPAASIVAAMPIVLAAAALAILPALPAAAHNYVVSSTPAAGETLTAVPEFFVVTTNDALLDLTGEGAGFVMQVTDESGLYYGDGCVSVQGFSMAMAGALGGAGDYTLTFQAISGDGHTISDELAFRYEPAAGAVEQAGVASAPECDTTNATVDGGGATTPPADEASTVVGFIVGIIVGLVALAVLVALVIRLRSRTDAGEADDLAEEAVPPTGG